MHLSNNSENTQFKERSSNKYNVGQCFNSLHITQIPKNRYGESMSLRQITGDPLLMHSVSKLGTYFIARKPLD